MTPRNGRRVIGFPGRFSSTQISGIGVVCACENVADTTKALLLLAPKMSQHRTGLVRETSLVRQNNNETQYSVGK